MFFPSAAEPEIEADVLLSSRKAALALYLAAPFETGPPAAAIRIFRITARKSGKR